MKRKQNDLLVDAVHAALVNHDLDEIFVVLACSVGIAMSELAGDDNERYTELAKELLTIVTTRRAKDILEGVGA